MKKVVLTISTFVLTISALVFAADRERFAIGYDDGISLRFSLLKNTTLSVIGRPSENSGETIGDDIYIDEYYKRVQDNGSDNTYHEESETKSKGVGIFCKFAYKIDSKRGFGASPYLKIGGDYGKTTRTYSFWNEYVGPHRDYQSTSDKQTTKGSYSYKKTSAEIGIMPGYTYKWLTIQFSVGIGVEKILSEPEDGSTGYDRHAKKVYFTYPKYDIINAISIHLGVF